MWFLRLVVLGIFWAYTSSKDHSTLSTESTDSSSPSPATTVEPSNVNVTLISCDINDVNCTNSSTTTENHKIDKNKTKEKTTGKQHSPKYGLETSICSCNLQAHFCDINCCCDPDCSANDKAVFKYCEIDQNRFFDDRYCSYIKHIYVNNTPFVWEVNQDGLFCILSTNLPESHLLQNEKPIESIVDLKAQVPYWHLDTDQRLEDEFQIGPKNYAFGDPIMIVKNDSIIDVLRMPNNILTPSCIFNEDVLFLKDDNHVCSQINIDDDNGMLSFSSFFKNFKVIGNPRLVNVSKAKGNFYNNCPKNVCIEIESKLCDVQLNNCTKLENITNTKMQCSFDLRNNLNTCQNAVKKIHYKFYHDGANGLHKIELLGMIKNFSYHFGSQDIQFTQEFSVEFLWTNQTKNYSQIFSGNPGYIMGKPILKGSKLLNGNITTVMQRNSSDFIENYFVFPENLNGKCARNETYNIPIEFGYNVKTKCQLETVVSYNVSDNATTMCRNIQKTIFDLWEVPREVNRSLIFGLFGNAVPAIEEYWNAVLYRTEPHTVLNQTQGNMTNKNTTLVCYNLSTLFSVEVFYSRVDLKTLLNQHKILGMSFSFSNIRQKIFLLKRKNNRFTLDLSLELISQASFYDVTSKKQKKFVDAPSLEIRLPYDFFYPFIKIGSRASLLMPNIVLLVVLCWSLFV